MFEHCRRSTHDDDGVGLRTLLMMAYAYAVVDGVRTPSTRAYAFEVRTRQKEHYLRMFMLNYGLSKSCAITHNGIV